MKFPQTFKKQQIEQPWICYLVSRVSNTILPTRVDLDELDLKIDDDEVPADIQEAANRATLDLLPSKSRQKFPQTFKKQQIEQPWICYLVSRVSNTILPTTV
ncbi:hypothetical protein QE152_g36703 [Popillia japonica]|uniref:Uncharacterized protein n=1 Tax=Popillia japonica TaxID=7064 RepID=A0AAW1ICI5_POPJA